MISATPLLRTPAFLSLWTLGALNSTGRWLEMLVIAIFVLERTDSPFLVASMLMLRLLPMALFGLFGGMLAHRFQRWWILRYASASIVILAFALLALANAGALEVWHVGAASFVSGMVWSTDFPVRRTLMGDIAGPSRVSQAMSLDILAGATTRTLGPLIGGLLYQSVGLSGAFGLCALLYSLGLLILLAQRQRAPEATTSALAIRASLSQGWQALRGSDALPAILAVTVVFNLWGFPFVSMVPVFAREVLALDAAATGLFVSLEGGGALLGALLLSMFAKSEHARYLYAGAVVLYCVMALCFGLTSWLTLAAGLLLAIGLVSAAFGSMQSALILMNAPTGMERQMMGILSLCIGTAPLGFLHIGFLADWLGTANACAITAAEGLVAMLLVLWRWPSLLNLQPLRDEQADP